MAMVKWYTRSVMLILYDSTKSYNFVHYSNDVNICKPIKIDYGDILGPY
jgi:hypothetical protein